MRFPDYAHGVIYTQTTTVTLDVDTLIILRVATNPSLQAQINLSVDGTEVMIVASFNLGYHGGAALPIKAGSVVTVTLLGNAKVVLYPLTK